MQNAPENRSLAGFSGPAGPLEVNHLWNALPAGVAPAKIRRVMNPILVPQSIFCMNSKSSRGVLAGIACLATVVIALANSSCATSRGFGRDVEHLGEEIQQATYH